MTAERGGAPYLKRMKITSFGAFANKVAGPFTPHLNVVFGENEAGKSTLASFAGGVLFGWEEARGVRNTYKPRNAERAGSLFFAPRPEEGDALPDEGAPVPAPASGAEYGAPASDPDNELVLSRVRNADGLQGPAELVDDIDRETFQTMFSLTADELRSLRNTTDMTAKLLTAGSGTGASPAHALVEVQARLAEYTSKAAGIEHSITRLTAEQDDLRAQMAQAADETERYKAQDKEFHELAPQRAQLLARLDALNASIEELAAQRASLEKLDAQRDQLRRRTRLPARGRGSPWPPSIVCASRPWTRRSWPWAPPTSAPCATASTRWPRSRRNARTAWTLPRRTAQRPLPPTRRCSKPRTCIRCTRGAVASAACRWGCPSRCPSCSWQPACRCSCTAARSPACRSPRSA